MDLIVLGVGNANPDAYCALLDNDQLIPCLATAATFPGFQELTLPTFAPTYKKKVSQGDLGGLIHRKEIAAIQRDISIVKLSMVAMTMS